MMMGLNGIFAILATVGGIMYVVVIVGSILFGKARDQATIEASPAIGMSGGAAVASYGSEGTIKLPGTITLVSVFFTAFVLYYYVNWKYLSEIWPLN